MTASRNSFGFMRVGGANPTLNLYTQDPAVRSPYVFGLGVNDTGRISTSTRNGAVIEFPDAYGFGEAVELRYRTADTGNGQFQGLYLQTRSDVANSSTIRAAEFEARQGAAVAIGDLTGIRAIANIASSSTGNITTARGAEIGVSVDDTYTGTVTNLYGLHVKCQLEDGMTVTTGFGIYVENEAVTGAERLTAVIGAASTGVGGFRYGLYLPELTNGSGNEVVLARFLGANGTEYFLIHDTDSATAVSVVTTDPTS